MTKSSGFVGSVKVTYFLPHGHRAVVVIYLSSDMRFTCVDKYIKHTFPVQVFIFDGLYGLICIHTVVI